MFAFISITIVVIQTLISERSPKLTLIVFIITFIDHHITFIDFHESLRKLVKVK